MKKIKFIIISLFINFASIGQNLILNPGFEDLNTIVTGGNQLKNADFWDIGCGGFTTWLKSHYQFNPGTPDLFDRFAQIPQNSLCVNYVQIPDNKWSSLEERCGNNRYVGISGGKIHDLYGQEFTDYNETILGTLSETLNANCEYEISFYAAAILGYSLNCPSGNPVLLTPSPDFNKLEVLLRKGNDCELSKLVFASSNIDDFDWQHFTGYFTLNSQEAAIGYDRIEFRLIPRRKSENPADDSHSVFIDDVYLALSYLPINPDFSLIAEHEEGNPYFTVEAIVNSIPLGSHFWWMVCEVDDQNNIIGNMMIDPQNWQYYTLHYNNPFPGYCCNPTVYAGNGIFEYGHKYRISRATWSDCAPYTFIHKYVYFGPNKSKSNKSSDTLIIETSRHPIIESNNVLLLDLRKPELLKNSLVDNIYIYPTPFSEELTLEVDINDIQNLFQIEILNVNGSIVKSFVIKFDEVKKQVLNLSFLENGVYFLKINTGEKTISRKIIKM